MDRILSARIDDAVYRAISDLSAKMHTSKKAVIEKAVRLLLQRFEHDKKNDVFGDTCGAWKRNEAPGKTLSDIRAEFGRSMKRRVL